MLNKFQLNMMHCRSNLFVVEFLYTSELFRKAFESLANKTKFTILYSIDIRGLRTFFHNGNVTVRLPRDINPGL